MYFPNIPSDFNAINVVVSTSIIMSLSFTGMYFIAEIVGTHLFVGVSPQTQRYHLLNSAHDDDDVDVSTMLT